MKIFRAYIITAVVCLCITLSLSAVFVADENAKRIALGEESAVLVFGNMTEKQHNDSFCLTPVLCELKKGAEKAASIAPTPISNIYWFVVNSKNLMN